MNSSARDGKAFMLAGPMLNTVRTLVNRSAQVVPGQSNLSPAVVLNTPADAAAFLLLLSSPTNGHKLLIPVSMARLATTLVNRTARDLNGQVIKS